MTKPFKYLLIAITVVTVFVAGDISSWLGQTIQVSRGVPVTPTPRLHVLFVESYHYLPPADRSESEYRCTAVTESGEQIDLPPYLGPHPKMTSGSWFNVTRRHRTVYQAIADLPTDKGSLTISCPGTKPLMLARPGSPLLWPILGVWAVVLIIALIVRRLVKRMGRGNKPGYGGPSYY